MLEILSASLKLFGNFQPVFGHNRSSTMFSFLLFFFPFLPRFSAKCSKSHYPKNPYPRRKHSSSTVYFGVGLCWTHKKQHDFVFQQADMWQVMTARYKLFEIIARSLAPDRVWVVYHFSAAFGILVLLDYFGKGFFLRHFSLIHFLKLVCKLK